MPLFHRTQLGERYDVAIMSTKGLSVTASRMLVDRLCAEYDIPLLVLHDFDKAGFSILGTLQRDTRRYVFQNEIRVIDLGLRLSDVQEWKLESETVSYGNNNPNSNLKKNGATEEEIKFLHSGWGDRQRVGQRVELNAFASGDLIQWIEGKLQQLGITKVLPDEGTLKTAYQRAFGLELLKQRVEAMTPQVLEEAARKAVPQGLASELKARLEENPEQPWDEVVGEMAQKAIATKDSDE
jgi:hypothetical protein